MHYFLKKSQSVKTDFFLYLTCIAKENDVIMSTMNRLLSFTDIREVQA